MVIRRVTTGKSLPESANKGANKKSSRGCFFCVGTIVCQVLLGHAHAVFLAELVHAAGRVHDLLLAGVKRMALGADFNVQWLVQGGTGFEFIAATAGYVNFFVFGMAFGFHGGFLS
jgi:hypothetical protein